MPGLWSRLMGRRDAEAVERDVELQQSAAARHFEKESIDDEKADASAAEHLGGIDPARLLEDDEPPPS